MHDTSLKLYIAVRSFYFIKVACSRLNVKKKNLKNIFRGLGAKKVYGYISKEVFRLVSLSPLNLKISEKKQYFNKSIKHVE